MRSAEEGARTSALRPDWLAGGLLALTTLVVLTMTLGDYGMAWDEGYTVEREERLREWFGRVMGVSGVETAWSPRMSKLEPRAEYLRRAGVASGSPWSRESLHFYWQFAREEPNGHPPFYALLGLAGWLVSHAFLSPLDSYRFGPAALFAVTVGAVYVELARRYGRLTGILASAGLAAMPRMFAHAHLASYDVPTMCLWFFAVAGFLQATESTQSRRRAGLGLVLFGVAWGCAAGTKLTGWFIPVPIMAWIVMYRERRGAIVLGAGGLIAALVLYAMIPTWWGTPIEGVRVFLQSNLTRQKLLPIPTVFLGRLYLFSLPWYNTLLLTAIVTPPLTLLFALSGVGRVIAGRFGDRFGTMMVICWGFFLVLRALPNAPGHDGERQFLAGFVFLACLAGIGFAACRAALERVVGARGAGWASVSVLGLTLAVSAVSAWRYHPLQLSYYNLFIGGLSGAARAGLEPTYYWEAVTPDVRDWLNSHTEAGESIAFAFPAVTFEYLHHWGVLRNPPHLIRNQPPRWYVVMNRPGHLRYPAHTLSASMLDHGTPVYVKRLAVAPEVPLVAIYSGADAMEADQLLRRASSDAPGPTD